MDRNQAKWIVRNVASWCVGGTVVSLIKQNVYHDKKTKKVETAIGGTVLGLMITDHVGAYTDRWVDAIADAFAKQEDPVVIYN